MLLLFDFDGTLADTLPWLLENAMPRLAPKYRLKILPPSEHAALRDLPLREVFRRTRVSWWKVPFLVRDVRRLMRDEMPRPPLFGGVPEMLRQLVAAGHGLGLATTNTEGNVARALGPELMALFGPVRVCGASLHGKAGRLKTALRRNGVAAGEAVLVGDELRDGAAAREAGIAFAAVGWGYNSPDALRRAAPDFFLETPAALAARFRDMPSKPAAV
jgi:phosphoglycolate phosphatase